jgi:Domain of unknown function (DUF4173)
MKAKPMTLAATISPPDPQNLKFHETALAAIGLTALSDWLLFGAPIGLSLVLFAFALGGASLWLHRLTVSHRKLAFGALGYVVALLPILENISELSLTVSICLFSIVSLWLADELRGSLFAKLRRLLGFFLSAPIAAPVGFVRWRQAAQALGRPMLRFAAVGMWIMPLVIGLVFLGLFEEANPLIAKWIVRIDLWAFLRLFDPVRFLFWLFMLAASWPFLSPIIFKAKAPKAQRQDYPRRPKTFEDIVFGQGAILRSLLVFNALFAVQSLLDATYLIGGAALPDNMTLAQYAHRGAYPLVVTALMAALFVIVALREGSEAKDSRLIRCLVYFWIFQNVLLVLSSVYRLDLYVQSYALTYLRTAAFIWMGLVAMGLVLIVARLLFGRTSEWLIGTNMAIAGFVLFACCFVNFADMIARSNLERDEPDYNYALGLGVNVLPAVDTKLAQIQNVPFVEFYFPEADEYFRGPISQWRTIAARYHKDSMQDWRAWTLRGLRLQSYLEGKPVFIDSPLTGGTDRR